VEWLKKEVGEEEKNLTVKQFRDNFGAGLLAKYKDSPSAVIASLYEEDGEEGEGEENRKEKGRGKGRGGEGEGNNVLTKGKTAPKGFWKSMVLSLLPSLLFFHTHHPLPFSPFPIFFTLPFTLPSPSFLSTS